MHQTTLMPHLFSRIVCATDFSEPAEAAWRAAQDLARTHDADLVLVHAFVDLPTYPEVAIGQVHVVWEEQRRWVQQQLDERVAAARSRGIRARASVVTGSAAEAVVDAAARERADLVVVGTHGRTGIERLMLGSVAERIVRTAACPVLVIRPTEAREARAAA